MDDRIGGALLRRNDSALVGLVDEVHDLVALKHLNQRLELLAVVALADGDDVRIGDLGALVGNRRADNVRTNSNLCGFSATSSTVAV